MKTVGQLLFEQRTALNLTLVQAASATKIRPAFLQALESDALLPLPATTTKGFLKNYAEYLGLSSSTLLAIYRRDTLEKTETSVLPDRLVEPLNHSVFSRPRLLTIGTLILIVIFIGYYLKTQYLSSLNVPELQLILPPDDKETTDAQVELAGRTDPDATLSINQTTVPLSFNGEFRYSLPLFTGINHIVIKAKGRGGQEAVVERQVIRLEPNSN